MTEADVTRKLVQTLKRALPEAVVFKHWDHVTVMPDISVTYRGRTTWFEVKLIRKNEGIKQRENQRLMMLSLGRTSFAYYLVYTLEPALYVCAPWQRSEEWVHGLRFPRHAHDAAVNLVCNAEMGGR